MKIAIVGYATEGRVSYEFFNTRGHDVTICDKRTVQDAPKGAKTICGDDWNKNLSQYDVIVRSAGINPSLLIQDNPDIEHKITTAINEFLKVCPTKNIIGVTGTKGKGTTSTLIAKMLEQANKKVWLAGNIGRSPLEFVDQITDDDYVVLELSSFQLCDIKYAPHVMVCLMVVPEHLDWHENIEDYYNAKANVFAHQKRDDIAIYLAENNNSYEIASKSLGQKIVYYAQPGAYIEDDQIKIDNQVICNVADVKLLGDHNLQNICAAITAVWQTNNCDIVAIKNVIANFSGLPYRLEKVRELQGVSYYNDSFGTTPETAQVAIESFTQPLVLIVGGSDKGVSFDELAQTIASSTVHTLITIGVTGPWIAEKVKRLNPNIKITENLSKMPEIVKKAQESSTEGDVVLLSCGSASFGLFENYKDRGDQFNRAVQELV